VLFMYGIFWLIDWPTFWLTVEILHKFLGLIFKARKQRNC